MTNLKENIEQSLEVLFKLEKQPKKKKTLLEKAKTVYLQIGLFKVPFVPEPIKKYLRLRHSLYGDEPEVCLFVPNRKTGVEYKKTTDELIDFCVDYYTELLEKHKIKGISTVMPLKQLRAEYGTYEMRRKLVRRYDLFLCKNSLLYNHRFLTALGKIFKDASREPLGVAFPKEDTDYDPGFQENINRAIFTSSFVIKRNSDNYAIPIGTLSNTKNELKENLETVLDQLVSEKMIPGGIENVRIMYLWPSQSKPIPLFVNPVLPAKKKKPRAESGKERKRVVGVEGDLSTQPGKKVVVMPNGEVFVTRAKYKPEPEPESESESEESFKDDSEDDDEGIKTKIEEEEKEKSESEDDEEIEEQEERLMKKRKAEGAVHEKANKSRRKEDEEKEGSVDVDVKTPKKGKTKKKGAKEGKNMKKSVRKSLMKQKTKSK